MKYLVLLAIVVQALAAPPVKPGNHGPENGHPFGHPNVTGPPPHVGSFGTRPPPPGTFPPRHSKAANDVSHSAPPPKNGSPPFPDAGKPPVNGPPQNRPGQPHAGNARPKRHLKGVQDHPTGVPRVAKHTHGNIGSHSPRSTHSLHGSAQKHNGEKGHGSVPGKKQTP